MRKFNYSYRFYVGDYFYKVEEVFSYAYFTKFSFNQK